jgi:peroxiredoxin (alkyl hydroperoxide reductase subunit C)
MLGVGKPFPKFDLKAVVSTDAKNAFKDVNNGTYKGQWMVMFFYPKDFTFVCPTEIKGFDDLAGQFRDREAQVIAASTDSEFVHLAWRTHEEKLKEISIPMLADVKRELSAALGILDENEGVAQRATFIVDPEGIIRFVYVTDLNVGRNPKEVLRILDSLQTDELCPCNWEKGQATLGT